MRAWLVLCLFNVLHAYERIYRFVPGVWLTVRRKSNIFNVSHIRGRQKTNEINSSSRHASLTHSITCNRNHRCERFDGDRIVVHPSSTDTDVVYWFSESCSEIVHPVSDSRTLDAAVRTTHARVTIFGRHFTRKLVTSVLRFPRARPPSVRQRRARDRNPWTFVNRRACVRTRRWVNSVSGRPCWDGFFRTRDPS